MHRAFVYFTITAALWSISYFFWQISSNAATALFWSRALMLGAIYAPVTYLHFTYAFLGVYKEKKVFLWLGYLFFTPFVLLSFSNYFVSRVEPFLGFPFWPMPGPLFHSFLLIWFAYLFYTTGLLMSHYEKSDGHRRSQLRYLFLGIFIAFVGGSMNYLPWYKISIPPYTNIFVAIYLAIFAYAITVYHLMDIKVFVRLGTIFTLLFTIIATFYFGTVSLLSQFLGGAISVLLPSFIIAFTFLPLKKIIEGWTDRLFFQKKYNFNEVINGLADVAHDIGPDLKSILTVFDSTITDALRVETSAIGAITLSGSLQVAQFLNGGHLKSVPLPTDHPLIRYFNKASHAILDSEELRSRIERGKTSDSVDKNAYESLVALGFAVAFAVRYKEKILFIYLLGPKKSNDMFYGEDIALISHAGNEIAAFVESARLYKDLEDALEAKSQFISVVSHQMRTPISGIRWSLELLQQKNLADDKRNEFLNNAYHNSIFLVEQLDDVLTALNIQDKELVLEKSVCDLETAPKELIHFFDHELAEKHLKVEFRLMAPVKEIKCDTQKINKVIKIFLKNAVIYTPPGGHISVSTELTTRDNKKHFVFSVTDTGIGVTPEEQTKIFDKFWRSDRARLMLPDGMGLGMFIAKTFVEAHGGSITVSSPGKDKGSTFSFVLPIE